MLEVEMKNDSEFVEFVDEMLKTMGYVNAEGQFVS
jgi:hypothetical protein